MDFFAPVLLGSHVRSVSIGVNAVGAWTHDAARKQTTVFVRAHVFWQLTACNCAGFPKSVRCDTTNTSFRQNNAHGYFRGQFSWAKFAGQFVPN